MGSRFLLTRSLSRTASDWTLLCNGADVDWRRTVHVASAEGISCAFHINRRISTMLTLDATAARLRLPRMLFLRIFSVAWRVHVGLLLPYAGMNFFEMLLINANCIMSFPIPEADV